jgi:membrane associated rhomboid family serine protease
MLFFPYRADLEQWRFPLITLLICAVSAIVLANQYQQKSALELKVMQYCYQNNDKEFELALKKVSSEVGMWPDYLCISMLRTSNVADDPHDYIKRWAFLSGKELNQSEILERTYINVVFQYAYLKFSTDAPYPLTQKLWFDPAPDKVSALKMFTSIFAHADVWHLLGNLFFFFAFAATVEMIIGSLSMLATVALLSILTNGFYAFISTMDGVFVPTLGLSGIVFGLMGMFVCFLPRAGVRCFFWFFVVFNRPVIPAWLLVGGYMLLNVYNWFAHGDASNVNFVVHISGALFGYLLGLIVFRVSKREYATATTVRNINRKYQYAQR